MDNLSRPVSMSVRGRWLLLLRRYPLVGYFLLAFTLSWIWMVLNHGVFHFPLVPLGSLGPFLGPTLAAFLMTALIEGKAGIANLLRRYFLWRVHFQWYLVALLALPIMTLLSAMVLPGALTIFQMPVSSFWLSYLQLFVFLFFSGGPLGEEPGWRGFALPLLQQRPGPLSGTLLLGLLHGVWHLPMYLFVPGYNGAGTDLMGIAIPFIQFVISIIALTVIFTWLFNNTRGSLLLAMLLHASINTAGILWQLFPNLNPANLILNRGLISIGVALLLIIATRGRLSYDRYRTQ